MKKLGLALGGGGARGLAHIPVLALFDELGLRPHRIAGTSMGAIIGALYACGRPAAAIREMVSGMTISRDDGFRDVVKKKDLLRWFEMIIPEFGRGGLFKTDGVVKYLCRQVEATTFEALEIPLKVVAADYWTSQQVVFDSGPLATALRASMAIPGVFAPVRHNDNILIDGGVVNLVPYDLIMDDCDITVAVDVSGTRTKGKHPVPHIADALLNSFEIMQEAVLREKLRHREPDIMVRPAIHNVKMLEFDKVDRIYGQTEPAVQMLRKTLLEKL